MKKLVNTGLNKPVLIFSLGFLLFWQWAVQMFSIPKYILPSPVDIGRAFQESFHLLVLHAKVTLFEAMIGFGVAILLAIVLALTMDSITWVKKAIYPLLITSQTIPIISVAPLFIIWFGYGLLPKVVVVTLVCFFPVVISLLDGLSGVDDELINLMKVMKATNWQIFKIVKLPGALPSFFSGLKISAAYSVMGAVIGEWLGASKGIGVFMTRAQHAFSLDKVFAAILIITVLSMVIFGIVKVFERLFMPWMYLNETKERGR